MVNIPKHQNELVSIIIINWNGKEVFTQCLKSLEKLSYPNWELIVVDNGSIDDSEKLPAEYNLSYKNYTLIKNDNNLGFAGANNQGYQKSLGEYILLLNNDTKLKDPDFLTIMVEAMREDQNIGVMQPKIFLMDMPGYLDNCGAYITWTGFLQHWGFMKKDSIEFSEETEIFSAKGACLLTKRAVVEKLGLFDADFGSYFEETDFCWRVWLAGWKIVYYPKTSIYHKLGATSKKMNQISVNYNAFKNRIASLVKNLDNQNLITVLLPHLMIVFCLGIFYTFKLQFRKAWMIYSAILWNIFNLKSILSKRTKVQKIRIKTDQELFRVIEKPLSLSDMFIHFKKVEANF